MMTTQSMIEGPQGNLAIYQQPVSRHFNGAETPVVFLHADCGRASQWNEVMSALAPRHSAVALDFRGHGDSEPAHNGDYSYAGRAEDLAAMADAFGFGHFTIVAHSGGAAVALDYAAGNSGRVAGLLLVDPATDPRQLPREVRERYVLDVAGPNGRDVLRGYYMWLAGSNESVRRRVAADIGSVDTAAMVGVARALADWNPEETLRAWRGPTQIVSSVSNDNPGALYRLRPDVRYQIVPDAGHWIQLDQPRLVGKTIESLIAQVAAVPRRSVPAHAKI